jgi:MFS family permease
MVRALSLSPLARIGASAALLGLGQNGLLVALPVLVAKFSLPLSQWAALILLGSMLFLVGSPFWGRVADRLGPRVVVTQALAGYGASFALIGLALWAAAGGWLPPAGLVALVLLARVLYGVSVSGMVPACQQWSLGLHGEDRRVAALAAVSAGLSSGRLFGPVLVAASLSLSVYAPFVLMALAPLAALALLRSVPAPRPAPAAPAGADGERPPGVRAYLLMAVLLALSVAVMQLGLPSALEAALALDAQRVAYLMGVLLSLGAAGALATQLGVVRSRRVTGPALLVVGGLALAAGLGTLLVADALAGFVLGILIASIGAALVVPGYSEAATRQRTKGASAGLIAMAHTAGYGAAMLAVGAIAAERLLWASFAATLALVLLIPLARWRAGAVATGQPSVESK